jgi:hypothetical protein
MGPGPIIFVGVSELASIPARGSAGEAEPVVEPLEHAPKPRTRAVPMASAVIDFFIEITPLVM